MIENIYKFITQNIYCVSKGQLLDDSNYILSYGSESSIDEGFKTLTYDLYAKKIEPFLNQNEPIFFVDLVCNEVEENGNIILDYESGFEINSTYESIDERASDTYVTYYCIFNKSLDLIFYSFNEEWALITKSKIS